jgi:hypothetical protein
MEYGSRDIVVGIVTKIGAGQSGVGIPVEARDFPFFTTSRPAVGPTKPLIQWVPGLRRPGHEGNHSPLVVPRLRLSGTVPLFPCMPSWRALGQLYVLLCICSM